MDGRLVSALLNVEAFEFFARYVLSGFIIYMIRNAYVVGERPQLGEVVLDILLFGLVNQLVFRVAGWLVGAVADFALVGSAHPDRLAFLTPGEEARFYVEVLLVPILIGVVSGHALRHGWARGVLRAVALPLVDPIPRAYDHVFAQRGTGFVILTFDDGLKVHGYYGPSSRAGRDPGRSEIYLERLYVVGDDGIWQEARPTRAALISLAGLRSIEFIEADEG